VLARGILALFLLELWPRKVFHSRTTKQDPSLIPSSSFVKNMEITAPDQALWSDMVTVVRAVLKRTVARSRTARTTSVASQNIIAGAIKLSSYK
jgi:hypothetical protein